MPIVSIPGMRPVRMGALAVDVERRTDGVAVLRSKQALDAYPRSMIDCLDRWAGEAPERTFLADRGPNGQWRRCSYREAREHARAIAQYVLDLGLGADRPVVILSGNGIEHGLIALGCMMAGVPFAPVSPAYSLVSTDH